MVITRCVVLGCVVRCVVLGCVVFGCVVRCVVLGCVVRCVVVGCVVVGWADITVHAANEDVVYLRTCYALFQNTCEVWHITLI